MKLKVMVLLLALLSLGLPLWAAVPASSTGTRIQAPEQPAATKAPAGPKVITWATIDSINPGASRMAAATSLGKVYRLGGEASGGLRSGWLQRYDPATGLWTDRASMAVGMSNMCATEYQDQLFVPGGFDGVATRRILQGYNQWANSWYSGYDSMPEPRYGSSCAVVEDTLYVFGGWDGAANSRSCYAYNFDNNTWTMKDSMPTGRQFSAAVTVNGKIYVLGGNGSLSDLTTVEMYDPAAGTWTTKTPMLTGRGGLGAANIGGRIYVFGGGWATYLNTVEYYTPEADTAGGTPWTVDTSFVFGRRTVGVTAVGNDAYVLGGWSGAYRACAEKGATDVPVVNDAEVTQIDIPQYLGNYGVVVPVYVNVRNNGPHRQYNVPVSLQIDSAGSIVYNLNRWCDLDSAGTTTLIFPDWPAAKTPGTIHTFKAYVNWSLDQNTANDTMTVTSEIMDAVWYQIDGASTTGSAAQNFEAANDAYDCWIMEDFWIAGPDSLWLDSVYVQGLYTSTGPLDSIQFIIMPDSAGAPGYPAFSQPLWSGYFTPASYTETTGSFMVRLPTQVKVYGNNPGLWMAFQGQMNYDVGGQWYINQNTMPLRGSYEGFWYNPGGGFGMGGGYVHQSSVWAGVYGHNFVLYGSLTPTGVAGQPVDQPLVHKFALAPAWPNPARGSARLNFSLDKASQVVLSVYNLAGQKVATVASGSYPAGKHQVVWQGRDAKGNSVPGGVYLYRIQAGDRTATGKLVWLK
ncbi:T9SS type A sorting domain-containing protein [candidate division TA06 bacterium]|nr:T9SS type A sorting domain-containing protein [candidate division TA06 bacterium]